jgi:hypothetical protein
MTFDDCIFALNEDKYITIDADGTFIIGGIDTVGSLTMNSIRGKFDSSTTITGAYSSGWLCGTRLSLSSVEGSWSAEWKGEQALLL